MNDDLDQIDAILARLRDAWVQVPNLRLGQLIVNAMTIEKADVISGEIYCIGNERLLKRIESVAGGWQKPRPL